MNNLNSEVDIQRAVTVFNDGIQVIKRADLECLTKMNVEGEETFLGEVRHFKSHPYLKTFLPKDLSIAWTKMPANKELPAHFHPCQSLLIATSGRGKSTGDSIEPIKGGDIIHIPAWNLHGFKGLGENGFRALSIQFQEEAIFDSESSPQTSYVDREKIPLSERQLEIVERNALKTINTIEVEGEKKNLGVLKNFGANPTLKNKLPSYFSAAWVHLNGEETLDEHIHDTDSMIIITEGKALLNGDRSTELEEGDIVYIPRNQVHGFTGKGDKGFWGLSIQFQEQSLYENLELPQVRFKSDDETEFQRLLQTNDKHAERFRLNPIFSQKIEKCLIRPDKVAILKDCLQVMSNSFQRLMFARMALYHDKRFKTMFLEHLLEELGHDTDLEKERNNKPLPFDPVLEASTSWFYAKNFQLDDSQRVVMIQMVLEKGAHIFYEHFTEVLGRENSSAHISLHSHADEDHDSLGVELLEDESPRKLRDMHELLSESWSMLELYLGRMSEIILK